MYEEKLIGFDAREMWLDVDKLWDQERREKFLLKHDIEKPLSVDPTCWPSVFDIDAAGEPEQLLEGLIPPKMPWANVPRKKGYQDPKWDAVFEEAGKLHVPSWTGPRVGWDNLQRLKQCLRDGWGDSWKPCWIIGVTELVDVANIQLMEEHALYNIVPAQLSENWEFLGYDVADFFQTSFLSNAGYRDDEVLPLKQRWAPHLNKYHLFDEQEEALEFVDVSYDRDYQHGPFSAYGLYLIRKVSTE